ncbi:iron-sulfur cluster assembly protein [Paenarthrobacter sp. NPDC089714]|uniref:iron-sulfur cluster assembly protein n=1 Tax=Paenarthrobacter sp. NPDC089714 TaxID=3364377 RepID=UPI00380C90CA
MTLLAETTDIMVREPQLRIAESEASAALARVMGKPAEEARAKLRFGPGTTSEQLARVLDKALAHAQQAGLAPQTLVLYAGTAVAAEDIVRIRRKAHGVADWISSPTSEVTIVLRPAGLASVTALPFPVTRSAVRPEPVQVEREPVVETPEEATVLEALYEVIDPDLGVNVVDLGFIRRIRMENPGHAAITMTLTSAACPLSHVMERNIGAALATRDTTFEVHWEWVPSWRPSDITPDGREQLRAIGFSAF